MATEGYYTLHSVKPVLVNVLLGHLCHVSVLTEQTRQLWPFREIKYRRGFCVLLPEPPSLFINIPSAGRSKELLPRFLLNNRPIVHTMLCL
jgi:hypothetical protein